MNKQTSKSGFGVKGKDDLARSYGEMLLSGRAMEKRKSVHIRTDPKFKPRAKAAFGRKDNVPNTPRNSDDQNLTMKRSSCFKRHGWKALAVGGLVAVLMVQAVSLLLNMPLSLLSWAAW